MGDLFRTLLTSLKAKVTGLVTKVRLWVSPTYWRTQGIGKIRQFFTKLLDIRPRHRKDYYTVFRWMVSKRLAFAGVVILGVLCAWYIMIMMPESAAGGAGEGIRTYKYRSVPLRFYNGTVRILAEEGYVAYVGQVADGAAVGEGSLYREDGSLVYEGAFAESRYNGEGKLYRGNGSLQYEGNFVDNLYSGTGKEYRESGVLEYSGEFLGGKRWGAGELYNSGGNRIYAGNFQNGSLQYNEFVGKSTAEASQMYLGRSSVYSSGEEYCVAMEEISAIYEAESGADALEQEWTVRGITVLSGEYPTGDGVVTTVNGLTEWFGEPEYYGVTNVQLSEAVMLNMLAQRYPEEIEGIGIAATEPFEGVYTVTEYDTGREVYIYTYLADGLLYTFYANSSAQPGFFAYSIQSA